ncbi:hypothetical protein I100019A1_28780 [Phocaeicola vulgatus]
MVDISLPILISVTFLNSETKVIQMHSGFKYDTYFSEVIYYNILKISKIVEQLQQNQREVNDRKRYKSIFWQIFVNEV